MKRSEMINTISDFFDSNDELCELTDGMERVDIERIAEGILDTVERAGMKPPSVDSDKVQYLLRKYMDPSFSYWDEDFAEKEPEYYV